MRFVLMSLGVLGLPALTFHLLRPHDAAEAEPAMLVLILSPVVLGTALARGVQDPHAPAPTTSTARGSLLAFGVSLVLTLGCVAIALVFGALEAGAGPMARVSPGAAIGSALVTSFLEELGWAHGGITLARRAFGHRAGVIVLGFVWAAWHLVVLVLAPRAVSEALFPRSDALSPLPLMGFVGGCVAYRVLLTELRDRAGRFWPAAIAHATGNAVYGGLLGGGVLRLSADGSWALFPAPTGLVFAVLSVLFGTLLMRARRQEASLARAPVGPSS